MTSLKASLPKELETTRLVLELRNQSEEHYAAVQGAFNNPTAQARMGDGKLTSNSDVEGLFTSISFKGEDVCPGKVADTSLVCIPRMKSTGQLIGCIIICQEPQYDDVPTAGWMIEEPFMGQGLASEAAKEFLRFATEDLRISRIVATPRASNLQSGRVADKAGLVRGPDFTNSEGVERVMFHLPSMKVTDELMSTLIGQA